MERPIVMYSVQTYLAYYINTHFYSDLHYVWCTPYFDSNTLASTEPHAPETSNPRNIYETMRKDINMKDNHYHHETISRNIIGLRNGVEAKRHEGVITEEQTDEILGLIKLAKRDVDCFRPVIYVIPYILVKDQVIEVPYKARALPLSPEYKIEKLHTSDFDFVDLK